jgi:aspartate racemase
VKKIGIVGGVAWQSTVHYYSELCCRSERRCVAPNVPGAPSTPEISIESLDLALAISYLGSDDEQSWSQFDWYHRAALLRLEASGVDFALIACNSAHHRFDAIVRGVRIPVISIVEATAKQSARIGARQVLLLGTALTMRSLQFREAFAKYGVEATGPADEAVRAMTTELVADLQRGRLAGASDRLVQIARRSFDSQLARRPVVCLACTELPLAFDAMKTLPIFECDNIV